MEMPVSPFPKLSIILINGGYGRHAGEKNDLAERFCHH